MDILTRFEITFWSYYIYDFDDIRKYINKYNPDNIYFRIEYLKDVVKYTVTFELNNLLIKDIGLDYIDFCTLYFSDINCCTEMLYLIEINWILSPIEIETFFKVIDCIFNEINKKING
jgi:hypothetical protein